MRIKEDLKRDVLGYLMETVTKEGALEDLVVASIARYLHEDKDRVGGVLSDLEGEHLVDGRSVSLKIFVPRSDEGRNALRRFAKKEVLTYSPYWLFAFAVALLWIVVPYLKIGVPSGVGDLVSAHSTGIQNGIVFGGAAGFIGGWILESGIRRFIKWKILSPVSYNRVVKIAKYTVLLSVVFLIGFGILASTLEVSMATAAVAIFSGALAVAVAYVELVRKQA